MIVPKINFKVVLLQREYINLKSKNYEKTTGYTCVCAGN